jgi:hypothetical protein
MLVLVIVRGDTGGPFTEYWNGAKWTVYLVGDRFLQLPWLSAVSCAGPAACIAVGGGSEGGNSYAEQWNGRGWQPRATFPVDTLNSVSCPAPTWCAAVGSYVDGQLDTAGLVETWNGTAWRIAPLPAVFADLMSVSCVSVSFCVAVGSSDETVGSAGAAEVEWNGREWRPMQASGTYSTALDGVSCTSRSFCMAIGTDFDYAQMWNGTEWKVRDTYWDFQ